MKLGIVGLPQCGKTTLFNALSGGKIPAGQITGNGQVQIHDTIVDVPDQRIDWLSQHYSPNKTTHAKVTFQDITGVRGNQGNFSPTLANALSQVDGFIQVVRGFKELTTPHPLDHIDPAKDISALQDEFALNDMIMIESKLQRLQEEWSKGGGRERTTIEHEQRLFDNLRYALENKHTLRDLQLGAYDENLLSGFGLLTRKPVLLVLNIDESTPRTQEIIGSEFSIHNTQKILTLMCKLEMEIGQLDDNDTAFFMREYSLSELVHTRVIQCAYEMIGLLSFFTISAEEVRAWPLSAGASARQAAGAIHSDMQTGFIRAEVMAFADLQILGSATAMKSAGKWRLEGKDYVVQDGDILQVRFTTPIRK